MTKHPIPSTEEFTFSDEVKAALVRVAQRAIAEAIRNGDLGPDATVTVTLPERTRRRRTR